jgi:hypothetical protein
LTEWQLVNSKNESVHHRIEQFRTV